VQPSSTVIKVLITMAGMITVAGINGKPVWMRQPRTRMGGLYCIRLYNQVEVLNLYAYAVEAPLVDDYNCRSLFV
jgi:hypothetical protein